MINFFTAQLEQMGELDLSGEVSPEVLELPDSDIIRFVAPVVYCLHVQSVNNGILVTGRISTVFQGVCVRCLKESKQSVNNEEVCHFYEKVREPVIDVTPELREDLLINLPYNIFCGEDCKGLCPRCGADLNFARCKCRSAEGRGESWKELDNLQF